MNPKVNTQYDDGSDAKTIALGAARIPPASSQPGPPARVSGGTISGVDSSHRELENPLIGDRYQILRLLGVGGMGSVYLARDVELEEQVALKTLNRELLEDADMLERFKNEVRLARRVTHKNVARMFDIGEHAGEKFLTMEFVDGESLSAVLEREKRLSLQRIVETMSAVCAGLDAAHAAGVIHRDLKPDNVMLAKDGRVLVTDFGIARAAQSSAGKTMGMVLGTPAYMAPEQVLGQKDIDHRADIYALGAMLFEMFTGQDAWTGESPMAVATARLLSAPPDPRSLRPDIPDAVCRIVLKCLAKNREERFARAEDVARELCALTMPNLKIPDAATLVRPVSKSALPDAAAGGKSVAVIPFRNAGPPDDDYLAEGLTDDLIDTLSMTQGLRVVSRGSVMKFKGAVQDPRSIGAELNVQVVVEGSVRRAGGHMRITARLLSVADGFQLWAKRFDRPDADVFAVNDEAASAIAEALTADARAPARRSIADAEAMDLYLRARHEYHKVWPENVARAVAIFEQALVRAPDDPTILSGYAIARARFNFFTGQDMRQALDAAMQAVHAAPDLAEAHLALATAQFQSGDVPAAVKELKIAIAKGPSTAEAHWLLGRILSEAGRPLEAIRHLEVALVFDSSLTLAARDLSRTYALLGQWTECHRYLDGPATHNDDTGRPIDYARFMLWKRDAKAAREALAMMPAEMMGRYTLAQRLLQLTASEGNENAFTGEEDPALQTLKKGSGRRQAFFGQVSAEFRAYLHRYDEALDYILIAVDCGLIDLLWLTHCPLFEPLRSSAKFLLAKARVEERVRPAIDAYSNG